VTDDDEQVRVDVDYDARRWVMVPPAEVDAQDWAHKMAHAWAEDLGRLQDRNWAQVLELMLLQATRQSYSEQPDEIFLQVLTPAGQGPDVGLAVLTVLQADGPAAAVADDMAEHFAPECIELPTRTTVDGTDAAGGPVETLTCHFREEDGSVQTQLRVVRKIHEQVVAIFTASDYDIGRVLLMRDDLIGLAQHTSLVTQATP
jgi:hypothetical protein